MRKKSTKNTSKKIINKLIKDNWKLCHEIVSLRDGDKCVICNKKSPLDLDHSISRTHKRIFYETDLLNYLCKGCHTTKSLRKGCSLDKQVDFVTIQRLGGKEWQSYLARSIGICPEWQYVSFHEEWNKKLKDKLRELDQLVQVTCTPKGADPHVIPPWRAGRLLEVYNE